MAKHQMKASWLIVRWIALGMILGSIVTAVALETSRSSVFSQCLDDPGCQEAMHNNFISGFEYGESGEWNLITGGEDGWRLVRR